MTSTSYGVLEVPEEGRALLIGDHREGVVRVLASQSEGEER